MHALVLKRFVPLLQHEPKLPGFSLRYVGLELQDSGAGWGSIDSSSLRSIGAATVEIVFRSTDPSYSLPASQPWLVSRLSARSASL